MHTFFSDIFKKYLSSRSFFSKVARSQQELYRFFRNIFFEESLSTAVCEWVGCISDKSVQISQSSKIEAAYQDLMEQSSKRKTKSEKILEILSYYYIWTKVIVTFWCFVTCLAKTNFQKSVNRRNCKFEWN